MDIKDIKDLIMTIDNTNIEKVEIEKDDIKIMITKRANSESNNTNNTNKTNTGNLEITDKPTEIIDEDNQEIKKEIITTEYNRPSTNDENTFIVKSPIVGTFYKGSSPDTPPFVKVGDKVSKGQVLCIIEAMKVMNEIQCQEAGEIIEIFADDEDIVEYGQPLMRIRR